MLERRLVIIGDGETRESDVKSACMCNDYFEIMCINKTAKHYDTRAKVQYRHWVSYHPEIFSVLYRPKGSLAHSNKGHFGLVDVIWRHENCGGTTALFALEVGKRLGYTKIALCGIPLSGEYGHSTVVYPWKVYRGRNVDWCNGAVRSFSGKTAKMFGDAKGWW